MTKTKVQPKKTHRTYPHGLYTRLPRHTVPEKWFFSPFWKRVSLLTWTECLFIFKQFFFVACDLTKFNFHALSPFFGFMALILMKARKMNAKQSERVVSFHDILCLSFRMKHLSLRVALVYDDLKERIRFGLGKGIQIQWLLCDKRFPILMNLLPIKLG